MYTARAVYWKKWNGVLYEGVWIKPDIMVKLDSIGPSRLAILYNGALTKDVGEAEGYSKMSCK